MHNFCFHMFKAVSYTEVHLGVELKFSKWYLVCY